MLRSLDDVRANLTVNYALSRLGADVGLQVDPDIDGPLCPAIDEQLEKYYKAPDDLRGVEPIADVICWCAAEVRTGLEFYRLSSHNIEDSLTRLFREPEEYVGPDALLKPQDWMETILGPIAMLSLVAGPGWHDCAPVRLMWLIEQNLETLNKHGCEPFRFAELAGTLYDDAQVYRYVELERAAAGIRAMSRLACQIIYGGQTSERHKRDEGDLDRLREVIGKLGKHAKSAMVVESAGIANQRGLAGLRKLEDTGEYAGFQRRPKCVD